MNKLLPFLAFSIFLLVPLAAQEAFAGSGPFCVSVQDGDWSNPNTWGCGPDLDPGIPNVGTQDTTTILAPHTVTVDIDIQMDGVNVDPGATFVIKSGKTVKIDTFRNESVITVENNGALTTIDLINFGVFNNNCEGSVVFTDSGLSGENKPGATFNNYGTFTLELDQGGAIFQNDGFFGDAGVLVNVIQGVNFLNNPIQSIPSICAPVGGSIIPIDNTSLLLAGVQTNLAWIVPVVLAGAGFAAFKLRRK